MNVFNYIAENNPKEAHALLIRKGYENMPKVKVAVSMGLADLVNKDGEQALAELANIHPDKELFHKQANINCCGSDGTWSNVDGDGELPRMKISDNTINKIIVASVFIVTFSSLALIIRKAK